MNRTDRKTKALEFFTCNSQQDRLFAVREGINVMSALEQASCLLDSAKAVASNAAQLQDMGMMFGAYYLIDLAKAAIDAATEGMIQEGGDHV